jgi:hypothetical protein
MAEDPEKEQKAAAAELARTYKRGNSSTLNNSAPFSEASQIKEHLIPPSFSENFVSAPETLENACADAIEHSHTHTHTDIVDAHPSIQLQEPPQVSYIFQVPAATMPSLSNQGPPTAHATHTHTPIHTQQSMRKRPSGSERAQVLQNLAQAGVAEATHEQIHAAFSAVKACADPNIRLMPDRHTRETVSSQVREDQLRFAVAIESCSTARGQGTKPERFMRETMLFKDLPYVLHMTPTPMSDGFMKEVGRA